MQEIIPLNEVIYDNRARDGTWCCLPYPPNHEGGCPNFPKCVEHRPDFKSLPKRKWYAVIEEFDLLEFANKRHQLAREKGKTVSRWQARNRRHWQKQVVSRLRKKAQEIYVPLMGDILLDIPEACGINVFATMAKHGLFLKSDPDYVYKIMFVGKNQSSEGKAK